MSHTPNKWISSLDMHSGANFPNVNGWESFSPGDKIKWMSQIYDGVGSNSIRRTKCYVKFSSKKLSF